MTGPPPFQAWSLKLTPSSLRELKSSVPGETTWLGVLPAKRGIAVVQQFEPSWEVGRSAVLLNPVTCSSSTCFVTTRWQTGVVMRRCLANSTLKADKCSAPLNFKADLSSELGLYCTMQCKRSPDTGWPLKWPTLRTRLTSGTSANTSA